MPSARNPQPSQPVTMHYAILLFVAALGMVLRAQQYFGGRSLWLDEAMLALNIVERDFAGLLLPLDYDQGAPILFLWLQRAVVETLGLSEISLRMTPFLAGVVSLMLFYKAAKRLISPAGTLFAFFLFATGDRLIYYSAEVKQYSTDVLGCLLCLLLYCHLKDNKTISSYWTAGCLGSALIWFSHPVSFCLPSVGAVLLVRTFKNEGKNHNLWIALTFAAWAVSFLWLFQVSLRDLSGNAALNNYWAGGFAPPLTSPVNFSRWLIESVLDAFRDPATVGATGLAFFAYVLGLRSIATRDALDAAALSIPFAVVLVASVANKYPFDDRLILFLVPFLYMPLAEGVVSLYAALAAKGNGFLMVLAICLLLMHPIHELLEKLSGPELREEIRPAIDIIAKRMKSDDVIYVYYASKPAFLVYSKIYGLNADNVAMGSSGRENKDRFDNDIDMLASSPKRVWAVFSHVVVTRGQNEQAYLLEKAERAGGRIVEKFAWPGASLILMEFVGSTE